ncbi:hypothetical protein [Streptomyces sp. NPDC097981]|uniref:hypothetical protein n=1 Tax=Streptomyces sp. NPDC097981 TaxID=3155428 RepID=UPI0033212FF5
MRQHNERVTDESDSGRGSSDIPLIAIPLGLLAGVVVGMLLDHLVLGVAIGLCAGGAVSAFGPARCAQDRTEDGD